MSKTNKPVVSAVVKTVFAEKDRDQAHARWREVADSLRHRNAGSLAGHPTPRVT
ncbi:MAG: hypothetical protein U5K36_05235 [Roseovarius sp.]|nr:hypothetical protein [Roseovarius sp.]